MIVTHCMLVLPPRLAAGEAVAAVEDEGSPSESASSCSDSDSQDELHV